jgi:hypothetical protein
VQSQASASSQVSSGGTDAVVHTSTHAVVVASAGVRAGRCVVVAAVSGTSVVVGSAPVSSMAYAVPAAAITISATPAATHAAPLQAVDSSSAPRSR